MAEHISMTKTTQKLHCFLKWNLFYTDIVGDVRVHGGRHVDEVDSHHVTVGVGVLPNREGRRCYSGL